MSTKQQIILPRVGSHQRPFIFPIHPTDEQTTVEAEPFQMCHHWKQGVDGLPHAEEETAAIIARVFSSWSKVVVVVGCCGCGCGGVRCRHSESRRCGIASTAVVAHGGCPAGGGDETEHDHRSEGNASIPHEHVPSMYDTSYPLV